MWPFRKKQEPQKAGETSEWDISESRIAALRAWRNVGQEFSYLGRRMTVVRHSRVEAWPGYPIPTLHLVPEVCARYADNNGQVHTLVISEAEALALALSPNDGQAEGAQPRTNPRWMQGCGSAWTC